MKSKNCIRIAVLAALIGWPAVETYRLHAAKKELAASERLEQTVSARIAQARAKTQVANSKSTE